MWTCVAITVLLAAAPDGPALDAPALAAAIDRELAARFSAESITPAPMADDAEFLRRASLDLIGRIPTTDELSTFLADSDRHKRRTLIDRYLADPQHAGHFSRVWRALLLPEAATDRQLRYFQPGLEAWLRDARERDVGCDELVRGLIAMPLAAPGNPPQMVLTDLRAPNPLAYIASKEADPAKLASSTARLFLGIRLECAQCHDHPFDQWTHENFWSQAAFFAGLKRKGKGPFAPLTETPDVRMITPIESESTVATAFLIGDDPVVEINSPRTQLAAWITSPGNERFAQAMSNRIWGQLMGIGLVTPVDDFHDQNPPSHPEILKLLADAFVQSGFDFDLLYAGICLSDAYQRTSRRTDASQTERTFARMSIKALSGDQLFDSLAQAVSYQAKTSDLDRDEDPVRRQFLDLFADQDPDSEPETSVAAALTLINGKLTDQAADVAHSPRLTLLINDASLDTPARIDALFRATVSRPADADDLASLVEYVGGSDSTDYNRRLGDVFWMLLNSVEFRWNH
jgi:hypothetical protein